MILKDSTGKKIDGLLLASPANPTGTMLRPTSLRQLASIVTMNNIRFISDEIYHGLTYEQPAKPRWPLVMKPLSSTVFRNISP